MVMTDFEILGAVFGRLEDRNTDIRVVPASDDGSISLYVKSQGSHVTFFFKPNGNVDDASIEDSLYGD